jgi:hypothetical protein
MKIVDLDINSLYWNVMKTPMTNPCSEIFLNLNPKYKKEEMLKGIKTLEKKIKYRERSGVNNFIY